VIEENGGRGYAAPTPNELGKGQEEEEEEDVFFFTGPIPITHTPTYTPTIIIHRPTLLCTQDLQWYTTN
jgi:hypothetical protein